MRKLVIIFSRKLLQKICLWFLLVIEAQLETLRSIVPNTMDVIRSGSPDFANQLTVGKNTPMRQYQADKEYEDEDFLTSSLPLPSTEKDGRV